MPMAVKWLSMAVNGCQWLSMAVKPVWEVHGTGSNTAHWLEGGVSTFQASNSGLREVLARSNSGLREVLAQCSNTGLREVLERSNTWLASLLAQAF